MRRVLLWGLLAVLLLASCNTGGAGESGFSDGASQAVQSESSADAAKLDIKETTGKDSAIHSFECTYEGTEHDLILCLPEKAEGAPLIVMLHGYGSSGEAFMSELDFDERAVERGYALAFVTGAPDPKDATSGNGWDSGISEGSRDDVGLLCGLADYIAQGYSLDKERIFAVGFSNGAFMTHRLAMEGSGTFSACVSVSGKMPKSVWESRNDTNTVGFFQVTGSKDAVIPKNADGSARYAIDPAIEDVTDYWADSNCAELYDERDIGKKSKLRRYANNDTGKQVWVLDVVDGRHSWFDESITGIDLDGAILDFLDMQ